MRERDALRHGLLPPTLYAEEPSPHVDWDAGEVRVLAEEVAREEEDVSRPLAERVRRDPAVLCVGGSWILPAGERSMAAVAARARTAAALRSFTPVSTSRPAPRPPRRWASTPTAPR